jgi:hypothetical protein
MEAYPAAGPMARENLRVFICEIRGEGGILLFPEDQTGSDESSSPKQ